jgi:ribonuclease HI
MRREIRTRLRICNAIVRRSVGLVEEWWVSRPSGTPHMPKVVEQWCPPDEGVIKANADGAFLPVLGSSDIGVVLRNHHGGFLRGASCFLAAATDPERAEILACRRALLPAADAGVERVCLETDCMAVVAKLTSGEMDRSSHGPLVEEVKDLLKGFTDSTVKHVRRSGNRIAHVLAREGCLNNCNRTWIEGPPNLIVELLASECACE